MDQAVQEYVDGIDPAFRPLFDRVDGLVRSEFPEVDVVISYKMPTYKLGTRKLYVAAWQHGLSIYGWSEGADAGLVDRHPGIRKHKGTIQLTPDVAAGITDDELRGLVRATLDPETREDA